MDLFTDAEILIMVSVIGFLVLMVVILSISEFLSGKEEKKLEKEKKEMILKEGVVEEKMVTNSFNEFTETKTITKEIEPISKPVEIEPLIVDLDPISVVKIESEENKNLNSREKAQIELLKVEEELEHTPSLEDTITNLEALEEENAIISYQELLTSRDLDTVNSDDGDEPISILEVFKMFDDNNQEKSELTETIEKLPLEQAYQGEFSSTPYLSPISGIENENLNEIQLENTANLEKLEKEIRKTNEFLNILNELKKNLD